MFWFFGCEACDILAPRPGVEPAPPASEGEVLTTGLPGKSRVYFLNISQGCPPQLLLTAASFSGPYHLLPGLLHDPLPGFLVSSFYLYNLFPALPPELFFFNIYLFIWLRRVLVEACGTFSCGMPDLVPWPGIEPRSLVLGVRSLNCWTTREVPPSELFKNLCPVKDQLHLQSEGALSSKGTGKHAGRTLRFTAEGKSPKCMGEAPYT